jgi:hypothetical protein
MPSILMVPAQPIRTCANTEEPAPAEAMADIYASVLMGGLAPTVKNPEILIYAFRTPVPMVDNA